MRQSVWPTLDVNCQRTVLLPIEPGAIRKDRAGYLFIVKIYDVGVQRAAKDPCLAVRRAAAFEDAIIEEHAASAKTLVVRK